MHGHPYRLARAKSSPWAEIRSFPEGPVVAHRTVAAAVVACVDEPVHQKVAAAAVVVDNAIVDEPFHRMVAAAVVAFVGEPWEPETK